MTMTIVEPTDTASPEWPTLIVRRFARMTTWAIRPEATMDWRLTERARDFMWTAKREVDALAAEEEQQRQAAAAAERQVEDVWSRPPQSYQDETPSRVCLLIGLPR